MLDEDDVEELIERVDLLADDVVAKTSCEDNDTQICRDAAHAHESEGMVGRSDGDRPLRKRSGRGRGRRKTICLRETGRERDRERQIERDK